MNPETLNKVVPVAVFLVFGSLFLWLAAVMRRRFIARYGKERLESALRREKELGVGGEAVETDPGKLLQEIARARRDGGARP